RIFITSGAASTAGTNVFTFRKLISWKSAIPDNMRAWRKTIANEATKKDAQPGIAQSVPILITTTVAIAITASAARMPEAIKSRRRTYSAYTAIALTPCTRRLWKFIRDLPANRTPRARGRAFRRIVERVIAAAKLFQIAGLYVSANKAARGIRQ